MKNNEKVQKFPFQMKNGCFVWKLNTLFAVESTAENIKDQRFIIGCSWWWKAVFAFLQDQTHICRIVVATRSLEILIHLGLGCLAMAALVAWLGLETHLSTLRRRLKTMRTISGCWLISQEEIGVLKVSLLISIFNLLNIFLTVVYELRP